MRKMILAGMVLSSSLLQANLLQEVQQVLPNTQISKIGTTNYGLVKAYLPNGSILYVEPKQQLIFFGEIWTKEGVSITQAETKRWQEELQNKGELVLPLDEAISKLMIKNDENRAYLKQLADEAVVDGKKSKSKYKVIVIKSPTCPHCVQLDNYLQTYENTTYRYYAPTQESLLIYKNRYNIQNPQRKIEKQIGLISSKLRGFGVPFALVLDENYNLIDTLKGFSSSQTRNWDRYLQGQ